MKFYKLILKNMYKSRVKNRKLKKIILYFINIFKIKSASLSKAKQTALVWIFIWYISLFFNWINSNNWNFKTNAFNNITWFSAFIIFILLSILLFIIISTNKKEKIKITSNISFKDYNIISISSIFIIILSINCLFIINWLAYFSADLYYGKWIIMTIVSAIVILWTSFYIKNDSNHSKNFYLNDSEEQDLEVREKNNMKLPF